jgi:hypothetical protein
VLHVHGGLLRWKRLLVLLLLLLLLLLRRRHRLQR